MSRFIARVKFECEKLSFQVNKVNIMFNVNANLNLDVNIVLAIQGQKRLFQVLDGWEDKFQRKNITDHL